MTLVAPLVRSRAAETLIRWAAAARSNCVLEKEHKLQGFDIEPVPCLWVMGPEEYPLSPSGLSQNPGVGSSLLNSRGLTLPHLLYLMYLRSMVQGCPVTALYQLGCGLQPVICTHSLGKSTALASLSFSRQLACCGRARRHSRGRQPLLPRCYQTTPYQEHHRSLGILRFLWG